MCKQDITKTVKIAWCDELYKIHLEGAVKCIPYKLYSANLFVCSLIPVIYEESVIREANNISICKISPIYVSVWD